jgi:hypothetical protein
LVANGGDGVITEVDARNRSLIRTMSGFSDPVALASSSGSLFVLDSTGSVTKVSMPSGRVVGRALDGQFGASTPSSIAASSGAVFVTNESADSVTEINGQTMTPQAELRGAPFGFSAPTGAVVRGQDLWVTNRTGDSVTEIAIGTDRVVRVLVDRTNLPTPGPIAAGDGYVFTLSPPGRSPMVSQITPGGDVAWMMCNGNGPYLFSDPQAVVVAASNLWVVNKTSNSLTEMDPDSGALIRTIS